MHYRVLFINTSSHIRNFSILVTHEEFKKIIKKSYLNTSKPYRINYHHIRSRKYSINKCYIKQNSSRIAVVTNFFTEKTKINDVYRYNLLIKKGQYPLLSSISGPVQDGKETKKYVDIDPKQAPYESIVIIIESPHKDEYYYSSRSLQPLTIANGQTGNGIENCICPIINYLLSKQVVSLSDSTYSIIICNPVQYQTSLHYLIKGKANTDIKFNIWKTLFIDCKLNSDFI